MKEDLPTRRGKVGENGKYGGEKGKKVGMRVNNIVEILFNIGREELQLNLEVK